MESMVNHEKLFGGIYRGKKVLLTGHTGFKGSWLAQWLQMMGADVYGYALPSPYELNHISLLGLDMEEQIADLRDTATLEKYFERVRPDIVFHLAAQALVRPSYDDPVETISTNVMGTLHVFEAARKTDSVRAIVNVTSDKCYENREWVWGYRENDPMGGYDPYSASKGMAELLTSSYRNSFFNPADYGKKHQVLLASARAGNVIGGGDWATDRLIPDMMKAAAKGTSVLIRNPKATRPWQHVLEPLSGYLMLGQKLLEGSTFHADGWNFGPENDSNLPVGEIVNLSHDIWEEVIPEFGKNKDEHHEANLLMLDCSKANKLLKWKPVWHIDETLNKTIGWYQAYYASGEVKTKQDTGDYIRDAVEKNIEWTK